jgi:DNA-directed RNA polymerase subunit RPC12/RpoP
MANRELMCLECGHTFEVYTASDDDDEELEAECPVCGSVDTTRTYDEDTEVDEEHLKEDKDSGDSDDLKINLDDE